MNSSIAAATAVERAAEAKERLSDAKSRLEALDGAAKLMPGRRDEPAAGQRKGRGCLPARRRG